MQLVVILILALAVPFFLWFPERILGLPYILEEAAKLFLVTLFPVNLTLKTKIILSICLGVIFSLSEQILYSFNLNGFGLDLFFKRLISVSIMHSLTFTIIAISGHKKRYGLIFGFAVACLIHYLFNRFAGQAL